LKIVDGAVGGGGREGRGTVGGGGREGRWMMWWLLLWLGGDGA